MYPHNGTYPVGQMEFTPTGFTTFQNGSNGLLKRKNNRNLRNWCLPCIFGQYPSQRDASPDRLPIPVRHTAHIVWRGSTSWAFEGILFWKIFFQLDERPSSHTLTAEEAHVEMIIPCQHRPDFLNSLLLESFANRFK